MTDIKICGTRTREGAQRSVEMGANYLGFIFAPARRYVAPSAVATILGGLPGRSTICAVGVFVDEPLAHVASVVDECGLDAVQLHGSETPEYAEVLSARIHVIKAIRIAHTDDFAKLGSYAAYGHLIEPRVAGYLGGAGVALDWDAIGRCHNGQRRLFLSGGLTPETVAIAIKKVRPSVVDVSSGIETEGRQDLDKITAFIAAVRRADYE